MTYSVLTPIFEDERALRLTLPAIAAAIKNLAEPVEWLFLVTPSSDNSMWLANQWANGDEIQLHTVSTRGKFNALRFGVSQARGQILIMTDVDAVPHPAAFRNIAFPLSSNNADVCAGRIRIAARQPSLRQHFLENWARLSAVVWHKVRVGYSESRWALPGPLYAIRKELFPSRAIVPVMDDASIGLHAKAEGARFAYEPRATTRIKAPQNYHDWLKQKLRVRVGWAKLGRHFPRETRSLAHALAAQARSIEKRLGFRLRCLRAHDRTIRVAARLIARLPATSTDAWEPIKSTKEWQ